MTEEQIRRIVREELQRLVPLIIAEAERKLPATLERIKSRSM